ncbi:MAG: ATP-binding protein [Isosphaeraceae bacterium]
MTNPGTITPAELLKLIADSKGEREHIEFKKTTGELHGGMETLCGFLNGSGGKVLFGVTNAGKVQGQDVTGATFQEVANAIRKLEPPAWIEQVRIPVSGTKEVLMLETTTRSDGPYTFDGRPYVRIGNTTSRMPQPEYERRLLARTKNQQRWEAEVVRGYSLNGLDTREIKKTLRAAVEAGRLESTVKTPAEALDRFHLRAGGNLLRGAVMLFGRRVLPDFPQCSLRMARFRGITKTEFLDQRQLDGHAFLLLEEADLFLRRHLPVAGRIEAGVLERRDQPLFPPLALREALVNALCHRDYSIPGGAVNVAIYDDRLEITSSGLLPPGITVADLKREHVSRPRNPLIAEVFFRRGLIERWGRGTQRIVELCRTAGQPEPDFEEQAGNVVVRFRLSQYTPPMRVSHDLTDRQRELLQILSDGQRWRFRDLLARMVAPPASRTLRDDLQMLKKLGLVDSGGRSVSARWWLKSQAERS